MRSSVRAVATPSYTCVPNASGGGLARAASIVAASDVNGRSTDDAPLNVTTASCWLAVRRAAKARAARIASAIAAPRMLLLASMTRTTPKSPRSAVPTGASVDSVSASVDSVSEVSPVSSVAVSSSSSAALGILESGGIRISSSG